MPRPRNDRYWQHLPLVEPEIGFNSEPPPDTPKDSTRKLTDRTRELRQLLDEADFDDDTQRQSVEIIMPPAMRSNHPQRSLYPNIPRKYRWIVGLAVAVATAVAAVVQIVKE